MTQLPLRTFKLQGMLDHYLKITIQDERTFVGKMIAFDHHLNLVLSDCEEFRRIKVKGKGSAVNECEEKRALGLIVLRGEFILSLKVEAAPQPSDGGASHLNMGGPGIARGAGRGVPMIAGGMPAAAGVAGPIRGVGGPAPPVPPMHPGRGMPPPAALMGNAQVMMPMMPPQMGMGMPMPGMAPPPPPLGRGMPMPMPAQQGFHQPPTGQMPGTFRPGAPPGPMVMMGAPPQVGFPPPPLPPNYQNFRPPPGQMPSQPPQSRPPQ